jgi:hypothetical protein
LENKRRGCCRIRGHAILRGIDCRREPQSSHTRHSGHKHPVG